MKEFLHGVMSQIESIEKYVKESGNEIEQKLMYQHMIDFAEQLRKKAGVIE